LTRKYRNDTVTVGLPAQIFGPSAENGAFQRLKSTCDFFDVCALSIGMVIYDNLVKTPKRCLGNNSKHIDSKLKYQI